MDFADEGGRRGRRRGGGDVVDVRGEFVVIVEVDDEALTGESHGGGGVCMRERERGENEAIQKPNREMRLKSLKMDADALGRKGNSGCGCSRSGNYLSISGEYSG